MTKEDLQELLALLQEHEVLRLRGYQFSLLVGILVERAGHAKGLWRCGRNGFSWTPAGYNEPVHWVENAEAAVRYTLTALPAK